MPALARSSNVTQGGTLRWKRLATAAIGERSAAEGSGGLHETERSGVKEAWGAQAGRSGRQAKRCPNMRAEGTEETTGLAVEQSVSQNHRLEAFIV